MERYFASAERQFVLKLSFRKSRKQDSINKNPCSTLKAKKRKDYQNFSKRVVSAGYPKHLTMLLDVITVEAIWVFTIP